MGFVSQSKIREHLAPQQVTVRERERGEEMGGGGENGRKKLLRFAFRCVSARLSSLFYSKTQHPLCSL